MQTIMAMIKLSNMEEFANVSGGRAIETLARRGNVRAYPQVHPMSKYRDCSFSFSGLKQTYLKHILNAEAKHGKKENKRPERHRSFYQVLLGFTVAYLSELDSIGFSDTFHRVVLVFSRLY